MVKKSRKIYFLGSAIIALASLFLLYFLLIITGVVQVRNEFITITSGSIEATYDGNPVRCEEVEVVEGELRTGHTIEATFTGELINVGSTANTYTFKIVDSNKVDVTDKYNVNKIEGTITVTKRTISLRAPSDEKDYDGSALSTNKKDYEWINNNLLDGHRIEVSSFGERVEAGIGENQLDVIVFDQYGNEITNNYNIQVVPGALTVNPIPLVVSSGSASKRYDGTPLTKSYWQLEQGELLDFDGDGQPDHRIEAETMGTITDPGSVKNEFKYIRVYDIKTDKDVTHNYAIDEQLGVLEIQKVALTFKSIDKTKYYDGNPFLVESNVDIDSMTPEQIKSLLKEEDIILVDGELFKGHTWEPVFDVYKDVKAGDYIYSFDVVIKDENGNVITSNYTYERQRGILKIKPIELVIKTGTETKMYDGKPLYAYQEYDPENPLESQWKLYSGELLEGHKLYVDEKAYKPLINVYGYDNKGAVLGNKNHIDFIVKDTKTGDEVSKNYKISYLYGEVKITPIELKIDISNQTVKYDGESHQFTSNNLKDLLVVSEESQKILDGFGHKIVYDETKFETKLTPDKVDGVLNMPTLVIVNSKGEKVSVNYSVSVKGIGYYSYEPIKLEVKSNSKEKEYTKDINLTCYEYAITFNGKTFEFTLEKSEGTYKPLEGNFLPNHEIRIINESVLIESGSIENEYKIEIYYLGTKGTDKPVNVTSHFIIDDSKNGTLNVKPKIIEVDTPSYTGVYNGQEIPTSEYMKFTFVDSTVEQELKNSGYKVVLADDNKTYKNATDNTLNNLKLNVVDEKTGEITKNYTIEIKNAGTIKIAKYNLLVQTSNRTYKYEQGKTYNEYSSGDIVPENDLLAMFRMVRGLNVFDLNDKAITYAPNELLSFWIKDHNGITYELGNGEKLIASAQWTETTNTTVVNKPISISIVDDNSISTIDNYNITYSYGYLNVFIKTNTRTIRPRNITIAYDISNGDKVDMQYMFENNLFTKHNCLIGLDDLIEAGYSYEAVFKEASATGDQLRQPGFYEKVIVIEKVIIRDSNGMDVTSQFESEFEFEDGDVRIFKDKITIKTDTPDSKVYDGKPLVGRYEVIIPDEMVGVVVEINGSTELTGISMILTNVGEVENDVIYRIYDSTGNEITDTIYVDEQFGTLKVTEKEAILKFKKGLVIDMPIEDKRELQYGVNVTIEDVDEADYLITGLIEGHKLIYFATDLIKEECGEQQKLNKDQFKIIDENGMDVTKNYHITADSIFVDVYLAE